MKKVQNFIIDTSEMPAAVTSKSFSVTGDRGAEFILCVLQNDTLKYYNFNDTTFALGHNNKNNNLKVKALMSVGHAGESLESIENTKKW